jgi:hypothetical protein
MRARRSFYAACAKKLDARTRPGVDGERKRRMARLVVRDPRHRGADDRITGRPRLPTRNERAERLTHASL